MAGGDLIGEGRAKLQPKLQMIANGSGEVNAVRAEQCAGLRVTSERLLEDGAAATFGGGCGRDGQAGAAAAGPREVVGARAQR